LLEALQTKLIPLFIPNSRREGAWAMLMLVNRMCLGTFLSAEAKQRGTARVCSS